MDLSFEEIETMDAPEPWYIIVGDIVILIGAVVAIT
ncbi:MULTISPECIES: daptide-type RiPP [Microbacterium]|nr:MULTISPECIES: daptide-type RiPP [unclassified Microbacterium]